MKVGDKARYNGGKVECGWDLTVGKVYKVKSFYSDEKDQEFGLFILDDEKHMLTIKRDEYESFEVIK